MGFLDTVIVGGIIIFFLFVLYRALKEPVDLMFHYIKLFFLWIKDEVSSAAGSARTTTEVIRYG